MFVKPLESDYATYEAYVLATVGYVVFAKSTAGLGVGQCGSCFGIVCVCGLSGTVCRALEGSAGRFGTGSSGSVVGEGSGGHPVVDGVVGSGDSGHGCGSGGCVVDASSSGPSADSGGSAAGGGGGREDAAVLGQASAGVAVGTGRKEKNKRRRERRRIAKVGAGLEAVPEWRRRGGGASFGVKSMEKKGKKNQSAGFVGYFDELSDDVKLELKESRARRLIAENKRKAAEDEHKEKVNGDPLVESLRAVISMMQIEKRVGKLANDSAIGGWAKTVASAASKTTASEQSSGGLSLASIGSTPPVDAGGLPLSQREVAYREALVRLHDYYDRRAGFSDDEVKADLFDLRETYADVCYTPAQVEKRRLCKAAETLALGMGHDLRMQEGMLRLIEKIFEEDDEDDKIPLDANFSKLLGRSYL